MCCWRTADAARGGFYRCYGCQDCSTYPTQPSYFTDLQLFITKDTPAHINWVPNQFPAKDRCVAVVVGVFSAACMCNTQRAGAQQVPRGRRHRQRRYRHHRVQHAGPAVVGASCSGSTRYRSILLAGHPTLPASGSPTWLCGSRSLQAGWMVRPAYWSMEA